MFKVYLPIPNHLMKKSPHKYGQQLSSWMVPDLIMLTSRKKHHSHAPRPSKVGMEASPCLCREARLHSEKE